MPESKSCTCLTASCVSTSANFVPAITTERSPAPLIDVYGARPAARAFLLLLRKTCLAELPAALAKVLSQLLTENAGAPRPRDGPLGSMRLQDLIHVQSFGNTLKHRVRRRQRLFCVVQ